ncbi:MAG: DegT/DnrJ/EryC1/StrS family aminotransferase [Chloroflexi bacterium]|nr:DegT/DnrJ/EryC1/StrS family aminotransferase [Chloroflexota bacterium]
MARVTASGWYILGPEVEAFELEFAAYTGAEHAIGVGSGTDALRIALLALGVRPGDEVITAANAGDPTPMSIWSVGAKPVFVDVEPDSRNLDPAKLEAAITPRTKALLPIHLYGQAADIDGIGAVARKAGLPVLEDACQAHGAEFAGRRVGTFGAASCFSFYPTKNLGGLGDGGAIVTNDPRLAEEARLIRQYGWQQRNHSVVPGVNSRLDELQAAVLRVKLRHLGAGNERRREIAALYGKLLAGIPGIELPQEAPNRKHVYHLYALRSKDRDALAQALKQAGNGTALHYPVPAYRQPSLQALYGERAPLPVTEALCAEILSLPMFPEMTDAEVRRVADAARAHATATVR